MPGIEQSVLQSPIQEPRGPIGRVFDRLQGARERAGLALAVSAVGVLAVIGCSADSEPDAAVVPTEEISDNDETTATQEALELADEACVDTWAVVQTNNENSRLIAESLPSIGEAQTDEEARSAANDWFDIVKHDPELLAGVANTTNALVGRETSYQAAELFDTETNCFNSVGEQAASEVETLLAASQITPDEAPETGINTGVGSDGNITQASFAGISGDRTAVRVDLPNGMKFWVMERCGNPVFENPHPGIPEGPTDQPPIEVPPKEDDGSVPGPIDEPGAGGEAGEGPAGQEPDDDGYVPGETRPPVPPTTQGSTTTHGQSTPTTGRPSATTGSTPATTNPPVTATTSVATTAPQTEPRPPRP